MNNGYLEVSVYSNSISQPIENAKVTVNNNTYLTNNLGKTKKIELPTNPIENTQSPNQPNPIKTYNIEISAIGMTTKIINNVEIFPNIISFQEVILNQTDSLSEKKEEITIQPITLSGNYSPKFNDIETSTNKLVLPEVIIPEYIIIHDGNPQSNSPQYIVTFSDYIKNVASSEIYPTWPKETLKANILAIISFTLNRIYTEWYQSKGYNFTITSVTAYDQKYTKDRTIFSTISETTDEVLPNYIKRENKEEPLLAQYCDGDKLKNKGWLWQWGSYDLGKNNKSAEQILKYYYGNNLIIKKAKFQEGLPTSYPGYDLKLGSCGNEVKKIQNELNIIRGNYPGLIQITNPNGIFDKQTEESIKFFQKTFNLKVTGIINYASWYKISYLYLAVQRMIFGVYDR